MPVDFAFFKSLYLILFVEVISATAMAVYEELANALNGQSHVLKWFDSISDAGKESLAQQINNINVELMDKAFKGSITTNTYKMEDISPLPSDRCIDKESISEIELDKYYNIGKICVIWKKRSNFLCSALQKCIFGISFKFFFFENFFQK